jgi:hypothetical protein
MLWELVAMLGNLILMETLDENTMQDKTWTVMNDLQEAFNQITSFSFLLDKLQEAVDAGDTQRIVDTTAALNAFYPPYCDNWDDKYKVAWKHIVKGE